MYGIPQLFMYAKLLSKNCNYQWNIIFGGFFGGYKYLYIHVCIYIYVSMYKNIWYPLSKLLPNSNHVNQSPNHVNTNKSN